MRYRIHHAPYVARGADTPAFAGKAYQIVMPAVIAPDAGKPVGEDAALQILLERLAHKGPEAVVLALPVELARPGQFQPGFIVLGDRLVQQRALKVARLAEYGLGNIGAQFQIIKNLEICNAS